MIIKNHYRDILNDMMNEIDEGIYSTPIEEEPNEEKVFNKVWERHWEKIKKVIPLIELSKLRNELKDYTRKKYWKYYDED